MPIETLPLPLKGLSDKDPFAVNKTYAIDMRNVRMVRDRIVKGPGAVQFNAAPAVSGVPRTFAQVFVGATLTEKLIMLTHLNAHVYNSGTGLWVTTAEAYTGASSQRFSVANTQDIAAWSQGTDNIRSYDGSSFGNLVTTGTNHAARILLAFNDRIVSIYTREGGTDHPTRIRWCVNGDVHDWSGIGSGLLELIENSNAPLVGGGTLGERALINKEREIIELIPTGSASPAFRSETRIIGTGQIAPHSWAASEYFAFFLGPDEVYSWDLASIRPVAGEVYKTITSLLDYTALDKVQGAVLTTDSEYWLIISETAAGGVFIYDYKADRWYRDSWTNIKAIGTVRIGDNVSTDIDQSEFIMIGLSDAVTLRVSPSTPTINSNAIDAYITIGEMLPITFQGRDKVIALDKVNVIRNVYARANIATEIGVSTDGGGTWTTHNVTPNADGLLLGDFNKAFNKLRIRIRNNSTSAWEVYSPIQYDWKKAGTAL